MHSRGRYLPRGCGILYNMSDAKAPDLGAVAAAAFMGALCGTVMYLTGNSGDIDALEWGGIAAMVFGGLATQLWLIAFGVSLGIRHGRG